MVKSYPEYAQEMKAKYCRNSLLLPCISNTELTPMHRELLEKLRQILWRYMNVRVWMQVKNITEMKCMM
jgi:hypothetical protein